MTTQRWILTGALAVFAMMAVMVMAVGQAWRVLSAEAGSGPSSSSNEAWWEGNVVPPDEKPADAPRMNGRVRWSVGPEAQRPSTSPAQKALGALAADGDGADSQPGSVTTENGPAAEPGKKDQGTQLAMLAQPVTTSVAIVDDPQAHEMLRVARRKLLEKLDHTATQATVSQPSTEPKPRRVVIHGDAGEAGWKLAAVSPESPGGVVLLEGGGPFAGVKQSTWGSVMPARMFRWQWGAVGPSTLGILDEDLDGMLTGGETAVVDLGPTEMFNRAARLVEARLASGAEHETMKVTIDEQTGLPLRVVFAGGKSRRPLAIAVDALETREGVLSPRALVVESRSTTTRIELGSDVPSIELRDFAGRLDELLKRYQRQP